MIVIIVSVVLAAIVIVWKVLVWTGAFIVWVARGVRQAWLSRDR